MIGTQLLGLLEKATDADLTSLDAEITTARAKLDGLTTVRKVLAARLGKGAAPGGNGGGDGNAGGGAGSSRREKASGRQIDVLKLLAEEVTMGQSAIAERLGIPTGSMHRVMDSPWFGKCDEGWELTPEGVAEVKRRKVEEDDDDNE